MLANVAALQTSPSILACLLQMLCTHLLALALAMLQVCRLWLSTPNLIT